MTRTKRLLVIAAIGYLFLALTTRAMEAKGTLTCPCSDDCWCKRPGLSVFRWVFPRYHRIPPREVGRQQIDA